MILSWFTRNTKNGHIVYNWLPYSKPIERDALHPAVRRIFSDVQKTEAVLAHIQEGVPVSQVCENLGIHPNQYYEWQKQAFSSLPQVFSRDVIRQERSHQREVDNLKSKLSQKDEVIAELLTEHIALKKDWGEKLKVQWVSASVRDQIVDFIGHWKQRSGLLIHQQLHIAG